MAPSLMRGWVVATLALLAASLWLLLSLFPSIGNSPYAVPACTALVSAFIVVHAPGTAQDRRAVRGCFAAALAFSIADLYYLALIESGYAAKAVNRDYKLLLIVLPSVFMLIISGLSWQSFTRGVSGIDVSEFDFVGRAVAFALWVLPWVGFAVASVLAGLSLQER